ncbi:hypothetical protein [Terriglobus aquaticus]|uniref:Uncharacterized protein n=1 Tax=Terriglobus aquaticus TaxID=940139 RepID=A0ABW9KNE4_9BACT|nr:hypothetical protein [Terriglobus aquaticus]
MTRIELLQHLITQARENGFEFRKWFRSHTARPWTTAMEAVEWLSQGSRAHMLLFSQDFARYFFREGERIRFIQPALAYQRVGPDGSIKQIRRRAHTRQSNREDVWLYHLREMAAAEEPLRYIRRYLLLDEVLQEASQVEAETEQATHIDPLAPVPGRGKQAASSAAAPPSRIGATSDSASHIPAHLRAMQAALPDPLDYDDELLVRD